MCELVQARAYMWVCTFVHVLAVVSSSMTYLADYIPFSAESLSHICFGEAENVYSWLARLCFNHCICLLSLCWLCYFV